ncbi:MAG: N-acetyltransferase [Candidatus Devosia symbiotica]|nr:N-acetyltransferase [Candidatus Devosia symbiotica]
MNDNEMTVQREDSASSGRYVIKLSPTVEAEMTYRKTDNGNMIIDHTGVPPAFQGRLIAATLVEFAIDDARCDHFKITPVFPCVVNQFRRHSSRSNIKA